MQPFIWKKFKVVPSYTYLLDLTITEKDLLMRMSNERRKNITKGIKDGLIVKQTTDYRLIKSLVMKTFSRQNEKLDLDYLNKILLEFADRTNSFAYATYNDNIPIACSFCLYDEHKAYYLLGGYDSESKHHGAGTMAMWEAIKHDKDLGLKCFDFEGSKIPHIERYFRGFGGHLTPYYQIIKARLPLEIILKFYKRELF
jgi:lipid II:glycine glycyltransferase (peptidoglycan interpeptide bridge formation enzyme)